jgi:hypothetical protein
VTQLALDLEPDRPSPNAHFFNADGSPKRLLWCSDSARLGGPCPYVGAKARFRPAGGCCKDLAVRDG